MFEYFPNWVFGKRTIEERLAVVKQMTLVIIEASFPAEPDYAPFPGPH